MMTVIYSSSSTKPLTEGSAFRNDVVRLTVRGAGTLSYDTQNGGNTTVPKFTVLRVQLLQKN